MAERVIEQICRVMMIVKGVIWIVLPIIGMIAVMVLNPKMMMARNAVPFFKRP